MLKRNKYPSIALMKSNRGISTCVSSMTAILSLIIFAAGIIALPNIPIKVSANSPAPPVTSPAPPTTPAANGPGRKVSEGKRSASRSKVKAGRGATRKPVAVRDKKKIEPLIAKKLAKESKPFDSPGEAQEFNALKRAPIAKDAPASGVKGEGLKRDPIPVERYSKALEHIKNMRRHSIALNRSFASENETGALAPDLQALASWVSIGPGNVGGRTRGLVIDPGNANIMYAAGVAGGVWKSTNGGSSWVPLDDMMANLAVNSLAMDPNNSSVLYAGTGEGYFNGDQVRGNGIFKTINAGASWTQLTAPNDTNFFFVNDIVVSKGNSQRVYAGTRTGVWRSTDGGTNWAQVHNPGQQGGCLDLAIRTDNLAQDVVFASFGTFVQASVYRNLDAGAGGTWLSVFSDTGMGRTSLAIAPSNQQIIYALAASISSGTFNNGLQGVFRSIDGGTTWTARVRNTSPTKLNTVLLSNPVIAYLTECGFGTSAFLNQGWYDNAIAVDPLDTNRVWVAGIDTFRSDDGGANFGIASHWWATPTLPVYAHADHHAIVFDPGFNGTSNKIMYLADDGGLFKTTDARAAVGGAGVDNGVNSVCNQVTSVPWINLDNSYSVTQFYDGVMYPNGATYFGGTQDNGTVRGSIAAGQTWTTILGGDGGYVAVDPTTTGNPATTVLFAENTRLSIQKSTNGGTSFAPATTGIGENSNNFLFIAPFIMDPGNPARLWTGAFVMWRTINSAGVWTQASSLTCGGDRVSAIGVAPTDGNKVLAGMSDGCINRTAVGLTSNSLTTWGVSTPRAGFVSWVTFDPTNSNIAYATYSSFNSVGTDRHVYKSIDSGATWTGLDGTVPNNIPDIPVHTIVVDPVNTNILYVGTDLGVFTSIDGGANWMKEITGFANVVTESLKLNTVGGVETLFAFTHGRGAWRVQANPPTAAKVKEFTATGFNDGRVLLLWKSSHEVDNLGYNVYREIGNERTKITPQIIAGSALITGPKVALTAGKGYAWADQPQTGAARYWLEDIDLNGKSAWTGPITIRYSNARGPENIEQSILLDKIGSAQGQMSFGLGSTPVENKAEAAGLNPTALQIQSEITSNPAIKLSVNQEGWYRIGQRDLVMAGLDARVDPRNLQLYVDGQQVPFIVTGEQDGVLDATDTVEFYGIGLNSTITNTRAYWLVAGTRNGTRIKINNAAPGSPSPASFAYSVERKDRTVYFSSLRNGEAENFFGPVISGSAVDQTLMLQNVSATAPDAASLSVVLQGVTLTPHSVRVMLNGDQVGVLNFNNQGRGSAAIPIAQTRLREGSNTVQLIGQGGADISLVDSVGITYWHKYAADKNVLRLSATAGQQLMISGFTSTDVRVLDITNPDAVAELASMVSVSKAGVSVTVTPVGVGPRLLYAFTGERALTVSARANAVSNLHESLDANYIIISRTDMMPSLQPLAALRQSQGHKVLLVDVESIYNEFSFGHKSTRAIKDFLLFAKNRWRRAPQFLLMAGDASYDAKNYLGFGDSDLVPTKLIDTQYMEAASDDWFTEFDGDGIPDMAAGRLPVKTVQEAKLLVTKIIGYEGSAGLNSVLLASDVNDGGFDFAALNPRLRGLLPGGMNVEEVIRGTADDATVKSRLLAAINRGQTIINYNGHGSVNQWRADLLSNDDAAGLTNSQGLSLFVMMTCMNGYFNDPALESLAEALMKASGGAAAVWASTAQTEPSGQGLINQELYRQLFNGERQTLGEATVRAKGAVPNLDIQKTWILFGDPASRLR